MNEIATLRADLERAREENAELRRASVAVVEEWHRPVWPGDKCEMSHRIEQLAEVSALPPHQQEA